MPIMETVTIINKSGKVVSTGKHLVNIFKDAKDAYNEKKDALRAEQHARIAHKHHQKLLSAREETRSVASSHRSHHSRSSHHGHSHKDKSRETRPRLTERALTQIEEGSVTTSRRSSHHGSRAPGSPPRGYRAPYIESAEQSRPDLARRHTDFNSPTDSHMVHRKSLSRSASDPDIREPIDMNLAYGEMPPPLPLIARPDTRNEQELQATMTKLDHLLLEAQCLQHSATTIIANLQANPEAMAAVALTLAELSNILTKMGPGVFAALKSSSPAIFALLASPQFLIAGGVAMGVTVVMFGGYKIIKKIQANTEANRMEEALVYDGAELGSIDTWRRGIAEAEAMSVGTSVDGEYITPEAARQRRERIKERKKEERLSRDVDMESRMGGSVRGSVSGRSERSTRKKAVPARSSSLGPVEEMGRSVSAIDESFGEGKGKDAVVVTKEKKAKKSNSLSVLLFKKNKEKKEKEKEKGLSHRPKMIEV